MDIFGECHSHSFTADCCLGPRAHADFRLGAAMPMLEACGFTLGKGKLTFWPEIDACVSFFTAPTKTVGVLVISL